MREVALDCESTGLLDYTGIDYTSMPYKLKDSYKMHCVVLQDINTFEIFVLYKDLEERLPSKMEEDVKKQVPPFDVGFESLSIVYMDMKHLSTVLSRCTRIIAHNGLGFDFPAMSLYLEEPYTVGEKGLAYPTKKWESNSKVNYDTWNGNSVNLEDTLVLSKILNADKFGGHSLDNWGNYLKKAKVDIVEYTLDNLNLFLTTEEEIEFRHSLIDHGAKVKKNMIKMLYFSKLTPHMIY